MFYHEIYEQVFDTIYMALRDFHKRNRDVDIEAYGDGWIISCDDGKIEIDIRG